MKIAVITPIPTPYRDPFWNVVAQREDVELTVLYCAAGKNDRPWSGDWRRDYRWEVLPGRNLLAWRGSDASLYHNPAVTKRLAAGSFDAVLVGGYNHPTMLAAMRWCRRHGVPFFLMCESRLQKPRSVLKRLLKDRLVRWVVGSMAGGFPTGTLAEQYLLHYGAKAQTLTRLPNAPDVEAIRAHAQDLRSDRDALRDELGFSNRPTLLFAGRLIPKKGAHIILEAMARMDPAQRPDLVIVGDGPERARLEWQVEDLDLANRVRFAGFVEPAEMVRWYVAADLFVLPSVETWGVVVAEALAAGTPVVVSDQVGCHPDLVGDTGAGRVLPRRDPGAWAVAIVEMLGEQRSAAAVALGWHTVFEKMRYGAIASAMLAAIGTAQPGPAPAEVPIAR